MRESIPSSAGWMPQAMNGNDNIYIHATFQEWEWDLIYFYIHRPRFMAAYFNQPDNAAHKSGPDSDAVSGYYYYYMTLCQTK